MFIQMSAPFKNFKNFQLKGGRSFERSALLRGDAHSIKKGISEKILPYVNLPVNPSMSRLTFLLKVS